MLVAFNRHNVVNDVAVLLGQPAEQVSQQHAFLLVSRDGIQVCDRVSANGTYVGDVRVAGEEPWDGSKPLRIEPFELRLMG